MTSAPATPSSIFAAARLLAALLVVVSLSTCTSGGENVEVCRRYVKLLDETREGSVSPDEYYRRVQPNELGEFAEGSSLRQMHEDLTKSLEAEDLDRAQSAEAGLQDECTAILNQ